MQSLGTSFGSRCVTGDTLPRRRGVSLWPIQAGPRAPRKPYDKIYNSDVHNSVLDATARDTLAPPAKALTPRQRRLAQQKRKWEDEQQARQARQRPSTAAAESQQTRPPPDAAAPLPDLSAHMRSSASSSTAPPPPEAPERASSPMARAAATAKAETAHANTGGALARKAPQTSSPSSTLTTAPTATVANRPLGKQASPAPEANESSPKRAPWTASSTTPAVAVTAAASTPTAALTGGGADREPRVSPLPRGNGTGGRAGGTSDPALAMSSSQPTQHQNSHMASQASVPSARGDVARWPSLCSDTSPGSSAAAAGSAPKRALLPSLDLASLAGDELAALARQWADELVEWEAENHGSGDRTVGPAGRELHVRGFNGRGSGAEPALGRALPTLAAARLELLKQAVTARMTRGSLGHQEMADLVWAVAHFDRQHARSVLEPTMDVPFSIVPGFMPGLRLEDFMSEVELRRDVIYLDDGSRAIEESRLTGWQSEIGATFKYSGKEMQPQAGRLSPNVLRVRDALQALTGVKYDSVLVNYYSDGKCGMRYHVDPLYGRWTPNSAVVSLGATRSFIFRAIADHSIRWHYRVRNGDVALMFGDCQDRLQHCVRVERRAEDAGPRMSLVFKERLKGPDGGYLD